MLSTIDVCVSNWWFINLALLTKFAKLSSCQTFPLQGNRHSSTYCTYTLIDEVDIEDLSLSSWVTPLSNGWLGCNTNPDSPLALVRVEAGDWVKGRLGELGGAWERTPWRRGHASIKSRPRGRSSTEEKCVCAQMHVYKHVCAHNNCTLYVAKEV